jgi:hypothetical protein
MGTITKACAVCGRPALTDTTRCRAHPKRSAKGSTRAWRIQRERILARDGYRCTHDDEQGQLLHRDHWARGRLPLRMLDDQRPGLELVTQCPRHNSEAV